MITETPEAIMINVPNAFFIDKGRHHPCDIVTEGKDPQSHYYKCGLRWFKTFYEGMGADGNEEHLVEA